MTSNLKSNTKHTVNYNFESWNSWKNILIYCRYIQGENFVTKSKISMRTCILTSSQSRDSTLWYYYRFCDYSVSNVNNSAIPHKKKILPPDNIFSCIWNELPILFRKFIFPWENFSFHFWGYMSGWSFWVKRGVTTQHDIENDSYTPHITALPKK